MRFSLPLIARPLAGSGVAVSLFLAVATTAFAAPSSSAPIARTSTGTLVGQSVPGEDEFLGIRYAEPPVGALRWEPPVPAPHSNATQQAVAFGPHCPQSASPFGLPSATEDCLFLNVYTPPHTRAGVAGLPVMLWYHGGAFVVGESSDYNPVRLVAKNVIVVTANYRLGALGFLAHPALDAEKHLFANYGLLDQQAALAWVRLNAAAFGGDARRITIFGESAGGASVVSQLASPLAAGMFSKAIIESGGYANTPTLADAEAEGTAFAAATGCTSQTSACLRALPVATILANEPTGYVPTVDGTILPLNPKVAFAQGAFSHVPVIDGSNGEEFRLFTALDFDLVTGPITATTYPFALDAEVGATAAPFVEAQYPLASYPSPDLADAAALTDGTFSCNALFIDQSLAHYVPTFAYEFADVNAPEVFLPPVAYPYEAAHASEIQYLFNIPEAFPGTLDARQQKLAADMVSYWTSFATFGVPFNRTSTPWFPFLTKYADMISLNTPQPSLFTTFPAEHQCAFWQELLASTEPTAHARQMIRAR
jgi:para-nitrobenzyl esterase